MDGVSRVEIRVEVGVPDLHCGSSRRRAVKWMKLDGWNGMHGRILFTVTPRTVPALEAWQFCSTKKCLIRLFHHRPKSTGNYYIV